MLFHVRMDVELPIEMDPAERADLLEREKTYSQELQRAGKWPHLWRIAGEYANYSVIDATSNKELHELLSGLPLFPHMSMTVTPIAPHPSDIDVDGP